ncbi:MAG: HAD family phosphatase [Ruminococcus sp.]|nr:HAD family phosphatase [Ruminococcus sp.]
MDKTIIKGAVFDMDGLMIDTEKLYLRYWKKAAEDYGYPMEDKHVYAIRSLARKFSNPLLKSFFGEDFPVDDVRQRRTELINAHIEENGIDIKKGLFELFGFLKENGIKIAVATATPRERTLLYLEKINVLDYIDTIVCGDMVTTGKPDPEIYLTAARELGLSPTECTAFEDSPNGIKSAYSAGCQAIMIPDMTPPDEELMTLLSGVYDNLEAAAEYFKGRI